MTTKYIYELNAGDIIIDAFRETTMNGVSDSDRPSLYPEIMGNGVVTEISEDVVHFENGHYCFNTEDTLWYFMVN